jgi:hypothetical protein
VTVLILGQDAEPAHPRLKGREPNLFTSAVGGSVSRHHGRRKHSSVDVQSSALPTITDPASVQYMITGDGSAAPCGEAAAIEPPLANVMANMMASLLMVERGAEPRAGVVLLISQSHS